MFKVYINRFFGNDKQTLGILTFDIAEAGIELFVCKTLELGWKDNQNNISCIPVGEYLCAWTRSNRLSKKHGYDFFTYEVLNVPNRSGIRIHSANYFFQLLGCIALGDTHKDINSDGQLDVIHSGNTINDFNSLFNKQDFKLIITSQI